MSQQANKNQARLDGVDPADKTYKNKSSKATEIPEAGNDYSDIGVFEDIKDYKASEYSKYLKANNPFLLISREGDVFICNT